MYLVDLDLLVTDWRPLCLTLLALMLLAFITRLMVRSAHLALSPMPLVLSLIFPFQIDIVRENTYCIIIGTARWAISVLTTSSLRLKVRA